MAVPWPTQFQQGQGQPQTYGFTTYPQLTGQHLAQQVAQQPYVSQVQNPQHTQYIYQQQPQPYQQLPRNTIGYGQQTQTVSHCPPLPSSYQMLAPQYQYCPPQQQPPGHQTFNQPRSLLSGAPQDVQCLQTSAAQPYRYDAGQQYQQAPQPFAPQQPSFSPTPMVNQPEHQPASTNQQHQYGPPSSSVTEQSPRSPVPVEKDQPQEKKPTVPCFNCGSFEHWAVSCPEPLREVPAGRLNRQNQQPPAKRQKFNAPIITKYQVPPHLAQAQTHPQTHQPPPYGHPGYTQVPNQYHVPPTPVSAHSPPAQWPQTASYPPQLQAPLTGYPLQQPPPPQHYPYTLTPQTPTQHYVPSPVSQVSPQVQPQIPIGNPPYAQYQQQQHPTVQPHPGASPYPPSSSPPGVAAPQYPYGQRSCSSNAYQDPPRPIASNQSQAMTPKSQSGDPKVTDDDGDDFSLLDVPDHPAAEGGSQPTLIGRPLPTNFVVADALAPFDAPAFGDNGRCKSKYFDRLDTNDRLQNVRETSEWDKHEKDPIFNDIVPGGNVILLSVLDMIYRPVAVQEPSEGSETNCAAPSARSPSEADRTDEPDVHDTRRRASASDDEHTAFEEQGSPPHLRDGSRLEAASEDFQASLGVTGAPKSVGPVPRPYPPPTPQDKLRDNNHSSRSRSASPRRYESGTYQNISPPDSGADGQPGSEVRSVERRQSYVGEELSHRWNDKPSAGRFQQPPPPPPPPARRPPGYDGPGSSPLSPDPSHVIPSGSALDCSTQNGIGASHNHNPPDDYVVSPIKFRAERSYSRKREYGNRQESSDEDETIRRRQADDITPKQKRRQPKVADAYSRRW